MSIRAGQPTIVKDAVRFRIRYEDVKHMGYDGPYRDTDICSQEFYIERIVASRNEPTWVWCITTGIDA